MTLVANWRQVLSRAWSVRLMLLAFALSALEVILPAFDGALPIPPQIYAVITGLTIAAAFVARLLAQSNVQEPRP